MAFKGNVGSVKLPLTFEIDESKGQEELNYFGYGYTKDGRCMSILKPNDPPNTERKPVGRFPSQQAYEEFGLALENYVFWLLKNQFKLTPHPPVLTNNSKSKSYVSDSDEGSDESIDIDKPQNNNNKNKNKKNKIVIKASPSTIFTSIDYDKKDTLLLLIPGSGAVRAGQWARSICINDNLSVGTMFPFIYEAYKRDWGVILFDPNGPNSKRLFSDGHVIHGFNEFVLPLIVKNQISNLLIVCHSAGGGATSRLLGSSIKRSKTQFSKLNNIYIAGTDTWFLQPMSLMSNNNNNYNNNNTPRNKFYEMLYTKCIVNWRTSSKDGNTVTQEPYNPYHNQKNKQKNKKKRKTWANHLYGNNNDDDMFFKEEQRSCGHRAHEYSSPAAFYYIFDYFDSKLGINSNNNQTNQTNQVGETDEKGNPNDINEKDQNESKQDLKEKHDNSNNNNDDNDDVSNNNENVNNVSGDSKMDTQNNNDNNNTENDQCKDNDKGLRKDIGNTNSHQANPDTKTVQETEKSDKNKTDKNEIEMENEKTTDNQNINANANETIENPNNKDNQIPNSMEVDDNDGDGNDGDKNDPDTNMETYTFNDQLS